MSSVDERRNSKKQEDHNYGNLNNVMNLLELRASIKDIIYSIPVLKTDYLPSQSLQSQFTINLPFKLTLIPGCKKAAVLLKHDLMLPPGIKWLKY